jgi:two-component system, cell cycle sensor histidine kinase and response regulator CckA
MNEQPNQRILVIDDNHAIHDDLRKILLGNVEAKAEDQLAESILFGAETEAAVHNRFEIDSAYQGQEGLELIEKSMAEGRPYAMAFVDIRMPPGWDGVETITRIWAKYPELQVVICTAYSDYSWRDIVKTLGATDNLLILKKPFDSIEVLQLAHSLTHKWNLGRQAKFRMDDLDRMVNQRTEELRGANDKLRQEILDRTQAESALRASEERFAKAFKSSPIPMAIQNLGDARLLDVNDRFVELTGFSRQQCLGHSLTDLKIWADDEAGRTLLETLRRDRCLRSVECQFRIKSAKLRDIFLFAETFALGSDHHVLLVAEDMTERVNLENQLRQAQKMEAVGQLAAGIAHDFNNMLTIIQGHVSLLLSTVKFEPSAEIQMKHVLGASERSSMLTRQLLAFSRKQMMQRRPVKLDQLFDQHGQMLRRLIGEHVALEFHCPKDLPPIFADACNIEQVIMNLAVNGRDAMSSGGRLTISAEAVHSDASWVEANPEALPGDFVCLSVSDTGCGMDGETLSRLFEPFFTTKEVGKGTGMGLATVYGIVKQHSGWMEVSSEIGKGSVFKAFLPVSTEPMPEESLDLRPAPALPRGGPETILVVEDEAFLREFVQTVLQSFGYRILVASDGNEAVRMFDEVNGQIDLLLTDMVMPGGMTGRALVETLSARKPDLRAIFTSGYSRDVLGTELKWDNERTFLQKPYQSQVLVNTVRNCLDEGGRRGTIVNNSWVLQP